VLKQTVILFLILCICRPCGSAENLALHKSYTFSPRPSYPLCTDSADDVQLTDGKSSGSQWTSKSTVGWLKAEPVVEIIIDLGKICAIDEVRIYTVGGGAATVEFPEFAAVLLSDDGREFGFAGLVSSKEFSQIRSVGSQGIARTMKIADINASGRFVKLAIRPKGLTLFIDEVEVLGVPLSISAKQLRKAHEVFGTTEELLGRIDDCLQSDEDIAAIDAIAKNFKFQISNFKFPADKICSAADLVKIKEKIGKSRAEIYRQAYGKPYIMLPVNPMDIVYEKDMALIPKSQISNLKLRILMWQNEYESAGLDIINCSDEQMTIAVSISPLAGPNGRNVDSDATFTIRRAVYVKAASIGLIADALVLQGGRPFILRPGELSQIWLTVFNPQINPGRYEGRIAVSAATEQAQILPIETTDIVLTVRPNQFSQNVALKTCSWAYYEAGPADEMAADLRRHYTSVCVVPAQDLPFQIGRAHV
jgi:hypothetical protein